MVKELIDVEWGQAVIDNLSSNEVYDILRLTVEMLADDMRITCRMTGESGSLISMGDWITEFRLQFVMPMVT